MQKHYPANTFSFQRIIPQPRFHTSTLSREDFSTRKPYPTNTFSCRNLIPQTLFHTKMYPANIFSNKNLSRKHFFIQKPYPANTFPCRNLGKDCEIRQAIGLGRVRSSSHARFSKPYLAKKISCKSIIPQTLLHA